jgi:transcriptional regulator with XRE-family HTH domain
MIQKDQPSVTGRQIAAARALLGWAQADLAGASAISIPTLKRMEASGGPAAGMANNVRAVVSALEAAGIEFIPDNGGGAGLRMRKPSSGPPVADKGQE